MSALKKLAGQTAVYGLPSIVGRLLNYLLVPIHTSFFAPDKYGIVSEFYAYVAFFVILLMMGMETTFFRFVNKAKDKKKTFNQAFSIVLLANALFLVLVIGFSSSIADWMGYPDQQNYVIWFALILAFDALSSVFLVQLRFREKAKQFALIQFATIGINILLNVVFLYGLYEGPGDTFGIGYIFIANLMASMAKFGFLFRDVLRFRFVWDALLAKKMLLYAFPLVIAGFAGIINETFDRILIKRLLADQGDIYAQSQVGIYSANYKLSILITLFITAYRYAAEPFFFSQQKEKNSTKIYSGIMTYFVIIVSFIFLGISLFIPVFKWFIPNAAYWEGLHIVPILLLANVFLGIYYNQSIWYKLADKTKYGAYIAVIGATITLIMNFTLIPLIGYEGSAITTLVVYFTMMVISYVMGRKHYPIKYNLRKIGLYLISAIAFFLIGLLFTDNLRYFNALSLTWSIFAVLAFIGIVVFIERPFKKTNSR